MSDVEGLAEVIGGGLRKCRVEDGVPVRLIREGDVYHVTHMVTEAILASPWLAARDRAARAEALEEAADEVLEPRAARWLRARAAALRADDAGGEGL